LGQWGLILFIENRSNAMATQAAPFLRIRAGNTRLAAVLGYKNNIECELALWNVSPSIQIKFIPHRKHFVSFIHTKQYCLGK
jgi:hypothetical protein